MDADVVYPILDSRWVSLVQCVTIKRGSDYGEKWKKEVYFYKTDNEVVSLYGLSMLEFMDGERSVFYAIPRSNIESSC